VVFERDYPDPDDPENNTIRVPVLYAASGRLYWYGKASDSGKPRWNLEEYRIPQPGGKIIALAVTNERLYALCLRGTSLNATLRYIGQGKDDEWQPVKSGESEYTLIQSIYADSATGRLFAGARRSNRDDYALLYVDDDDTLKRLKPNTSMLSGVVWRGGSYYLSTSGSGIFQVEESDLGNPAVNWPEKQLQDGAAVDDESKRNNRIFKSIIKLEDDMIIAVERNGGILYEVDAGVFLPIYHYDEDGNEDRRFATGRYAMGAITLWEDPIHGRKKLVVGIQGGLYATTTLSYTNGYVEFDLTYPGGSFDKSATRRDANRLETVDDPDRYTTSLGKHPINHLFQAPDFIDGERTFFASTQTAGLWSYRDRSDNGGWQWNAEEKNPP
jgi:hypothetical protein